MESGLAKNTLSKFVNFSILEWNSTNRRYRLHDLARIFAKSQLVGLETVLISQNHAFYYGKLFEQLESLFQNGGQNALQALELLDLEMDNIKAAQGWSADHAEYNPGIAMLCSHFVTLGAYILTLRLNNFKLLRWNEDGLIAARFQNDAEAEAGNLSGIGTAYLGLGDFPKAILHLRQALMIAKRIKNRKLAAVCLDNLGSVCNFESKLWRAIVFHKAALEISIELNDEYHVGRRLNNLGIDYLELGKTQEAIELFKRALVIKKSSGDMRGEANTYFGLSRSCYKLHRYPAAIFYQLKERRILKKLKINPQ